MWHSTVEMSSLSLGGGEGYGGMLGTDLLNASPSES